MLLLANVLTGPLHFKDCVVVTKGFYEGCQGTVDQEWSDNPVQYDVTLNCKKEIFSVRLQRDELKKCDEK